MSPELLLQKLAQAGVEKGKPTIVYCRSGHRSARTYLTLRRLGFEQVRRYDGSMAEWSKTPGTALKKGGLVPIPGETAWVKAKEIEDCSRYQAISRFKPRESNSPLELKLTKYNNGRGFLPGKRVSGTLCLYDNGGVEMKKLALLLFGFYLSSLSFVTAAEGTYTLQPGDVLEISVWKEPDLQREVLVRPYGGISFPLVGNIDTTGMSIEQLTTEVSARIEKYIPDPVVTVSLKQMMGNRIYILGKVNKPGVYPVVRNVDVLQALSMAGGMNPFADSNKIQILRRNDGTQTSTPFDYGAVEEGDLAQNIVLQPGDIVLVP